MRRRRFVAKTSAAAVGTAFSAHRTGRKLRWNAEKEAFEGNEPKATALLGRQHRKPWTLV